MNTLVVLCARVLLLLTSVLLLLTPFDALLTPTYSHLLVWSCTLLLLAPSKLPFLLFFFTVDMSQTLGRLDVDNFRQDAS
jgi:hypothetical protein